MSQENMNRRALLIGFAMLCSVAMAYALTPTKKIADHSPRLDLETLIPRSFDNWQIDESLRPVIPTPSVQANLELTYDQMVNRTYINRQNGNRMMISIAYGSEQTQQLKAHRQEVCYASQGFNISDFHVEKETVAGRKITVTRMLAVNQNRTEPVTYWFTVGDTVVQSRGERFLAQLKYAFTGYVPDGVLVRISNLSQEKDAAYKAHIEFINSLLKHIPENQLHRFVGTLS